MIHKRIASVFVSVVIMLGSVVLPKDVAKAEADTTPPIFNNISVDEKSVTTGDAVLITVDASDDISGIKNITVIYNAPSGSATKSVSLNKDIDGKYRGSIIIGQNDAVGVWKVNLIGIYDNVGNVMNVWNTETNNSAWQGILKDLSTGDFEVKNLYNLLEPLPQKYITQNDYWTSNTINGDLYIGPQAVLTIDGSVTVNGNIYVLGAMKNYGNLTVTGTIYASQFIWGNSTLYNGTALMLGGVNSIGSIVASNDPIDVPFKLYEANDNTLVAFDGKISLTGATLPIIDLYMDGVKVNYYYNGTFSLDLDTNDKQKVEFKTVDVFGNEKIYTYNILNKYYDTNADNTVNIMDLANVAKGYNTKKSDASWQERYDYNCDGVMDIYDLVTLSKRISLIE